MKDRLWTVVLAFAIPTALGYPHLPATVAAAVFALAVIVGVTAVLVSIRGRGLRLLGPWALVGAGFAMFVAGDAVLTAYDVVRGVMPFPSAADVLYLLSYPLLITGLGWMARLRAGDGERDTVIDAGIVTVSAGMFVWVYLVEPGAADGAVPLATRLVAGAYPVFDLLLLAMVARLLLASGRLTPAFWLLALSYGALLTADVLYHVIRLVDAPTLDDVRMTAYAMTYAFAPAALAHPSARDVIVPQRAEGPSLTTGRLCLLAVAALLAPALLAFQTLAGQPVSGGAIAAASATLFLLVILRMSGLVGELEARSSQVEVLARHDALTGVMNRRGWDERLPVELARARRTGEPVAVALLDLDHFKSYNDRWGHQAGDDLLRAITAAWAALLRPQDTLARYGGEEFGVILPGCDAAAAYRGVERLRTAVPAPQTCSAGVAVWRDGLSQPSLVRHADEALYHAKRTGRDRTVVAAPVAPPALAPVAD